MFRLRSGLPLLAGAALVALASAMSAHEAGAQVTPPSADVLFKSPSSISVHNNGIVFVADTGNHRVQAFHPNGTFAFAFGSEGSGEGEFLSPGGVEVTKSTNINRSRIVVADTGNHRVQVFHINGTFAFAFGSEGSGEGEFLSPEDVTTRRSGSKIVVADTGNHRVQAFHRNGTFAFAFGSEGSGDGQFLSPGGVGMDRFDDLFIADTGNHRIQYFSFDGSFDRVIGTNGTGDGQFDGPRSANNGRSYTTVADTGNHRVQLYTGTRFTSAVGSEGSGDGQLLSPEGAATGAYFRTYVADTGNHRVSVFHQNGAFLFSFGSEGTVGGQRPLGPLPPPDICGAALAAPSIDWGAVRWGGQSAAFSQELRNAGSLPIDAASISAGDWLDGTGAVVAPANVTSVLAGSSWTPLDGEVAVPVTADGNSAYMSLRVDLPPGGATSGYVGDMYQNVTYAVSCAPAVGQIGVSHFAVTGVHAITALPQPQPPPPAVVPPANGTAPPPAPANGTAPPPAVVPPANGTAPPPAVVPPANGTAPPPAVVPPANGTAPPPAVVPPANGTAPPPAPPAPVICVGADLTECDLGPANGTAPPAPVTIVIEPRVHAGPLNLTHAGHAANLTIDVAGLAGPGGPPLDGSAASVVTFPPAETSVAVSFATVTFPPSVGAAHVPAGGRLALHVAVDVPDDARVQGALAYEGSGRVTLQRVVEVGAASGRVTFDMPVRILLEGQAGGRAFYIEGGAGGGTITPIDQACAADDAARVHRHLGGAGECQMDSADGDKIIYTYHLTLFGTALSERAPPPVVDTCSVSVGAPNLRASVQTGRHSDPVRQVVVNSGSAPFAHVNLTATPWSGGLPASVTEVRADGAASDYVPLADGTAVADGLGGGQEAPLWFRLNLVSHGDLRTVGRSSST